MLSIDPCSAPPVIKAAAGAANGMYWFEPFQDLFATGQTPDVEADQGDPREVRTGEIVIDSPALAGLSTVMNVWNTFKTTPTSKLKTRLHAQDAEDRDPHQLPLDVLELLRASDQEGAGDLQR